MNEFAAVFSRRLNRIRGRHGAVYDRNNASLVYSSVVTIEVHLLKDEQVALFLRMQKWLTKT